MEENRQPELELSEAQLGEISGGCASCSGNLAAISHHTDRRDVYQALARIAEHYELPEFAQRYRLVADFHADRIRLNQARIDARHPAEGEPASKRQRLG